MRIAQVAGLWMSVPPATYGGTTRILSLLTEDLVRRGHEVVLFATGDARTAAMLRAILPRCLADANDDDLVGRFDFYRLANLAEAIRECAGFDVIHCHLGAFSIPFDALSPAPMLHTFMDSLDQDDLWMLNRYPQAAAVARSKAQIARIPAARRRRIQVIYNGHNFDFYRLSKKRGKYLAFLGRMSRNKSPTGAISIAKAVGMPIVLAGEPIFEDEAAYYVSEVEPLIDGRHVRALGPVDDAAKNEFLGKAAALLFPIESPEPFGNVMVEAMACGTPVVATRRGSVTEIIDEGVTGYYADTVAELPALVERAMALDRAAVRERARARFNHRRMVDDYLRLYGSLGARGAAAASRHGIPSRRSR